MSYSDRVLKGLAQIALAGDKVSDAVAEWRKGICQGCDMYDAKRVTCNVCGCYLEVKWHCLTNYDIELLREVVTHCPLGKWEDEEVAALYLEEKKNKSII